MGRGVTRRQTEAVLARLRRRIPNMTIRTTTITRMTTRMNMTTSIITMSTVTAIPTCLQAPTAVR